ncbi:hypothetical protein EVA_17294, partial [gut metagenome]
DVKNRCWSEEMLKICGIQGFPASEAV